MATDEILPRPMVLEEFTPLLERVFRAHCVPKDIDLTLVEAYPLKDRGLVTRPPFTLIFHSDATALLSPGIYTLRSGSFGPAAIYLEATTRMPHAPTGHYYQAVFN
ncbi:hypothetical protein M9980_10010 [Sphingomonas donggukensis]|uniref:DUF6916 domain-containing protein n=1 Tax=Sphingomonas donggukensis TaxID=2949093 RepID=A0ABY4TRG6_9SPHN|nr:hypothetical protein [Sphingomonas donggukensis]URW74898.1 hypothetical protein M9980_10010 [Sphingomonas donggukensis]